MWSLPNLNELYVYPDMGRKLALDVTSQWKRGQYDGVTDALTFAQQLTNDLQATNHDKHLRVDFSPPQTTGVPVQSSAAAARERALLACENCGFRRVEWLPANVGYVRFDEFGDDPTVCRGTAAAAMAFLANVDSIIFDLRENHGGDPSLVVFLESYLFASSHPSGRLVGPPD